MTKRNVGWRTALQATSTLPISLIAYWLQRSSWLAILFGAKETATR